MKTKQKQFIGRFIVCGFVVRHFFYCAIYVFRTIFDHHSRLKTKQISKKGKVIAIVTMVKSEKKRIKLTLERGSSGLIDRDEN